MKRLHLHIRVYDIESNIKFYSSLFALAPVARGPDCAQWILDTPQMTFTISERGSTMGLEHLGFHVDSAEELEAVRNVLGKNACLTGFYSYGEISPLTPTERQCQLHNQTMTITTFRE